MIEVTRLYRLDGDSNLKAFADITVENQVLIKGVKVVKDRDGNISVVMPKQKGKNGKWYETVSLLSEEAKQELQETVLNAFYA